MSNVRQMNTRTLTTAFPYLALGFGAAAIFAFVYGLILGGLWPYIFHAEWPFLGPDASASITRARTFDALVGVTFGVVLGLLALRRGRRNVDMWALTAGVVLYAALGAVGASNVRSALFETPFPWLAVALIATTLGFNLHVRTQEP
jgi:hypothetical protein